MSRTIFTGVLMLSLALAAGCGSKSEPPPSVPAEAGPTASIPGPAVTPPPAEPNAGTPAKVEPPKVAWEIDADKHAIPATAVVGSIMGADVTPEVSIEGDELVFRTMQKGTQVIDRKLTLRLAPMLVAGQPVPVVLGRTWKVKADAQQSPAVPEVWIEAPGKGITAFPVGYAMTLELGQRKEGKVAGKVFLSVPDESKTFLAGTFQATYIRPHTERPGPDDAPYATGEVLVTGAKTDSEVRVTYAAFTPEGVFFKELQIPFDPLPELQAKWTRDDTPSDKPRVSTLVAGDGRARPARYEHVKLPVGRYLLTASVAGGPTVWKWVDIGPTSTLTENFTIDATKTGGVQISTPAGVTGKVYIAPADAPDKPVVDAELFRAISFQTVRQDVEIVGGKATFKNLGPGKYEVRVGAERRFVDVVAGKTAEVDLSPPKK